LFQCFLFRPVAISSRVRIPGPSSNLPSPITSANPFAAQGSPRRRGFESMAVIFFVPFPPSLPLPFPFVFLSQHDGNLTGWSGCSSTPPLESAATTRPFESVFSRRVFWRKFPAPFLRRELLPIPLLVFPLHYHMRHAFCSPFGNPS